MKRPYLIILASAALLMSASLATAGSVPSWDRQINKPGRFKVLKSFNGEAVLDKETGLVWERVPTGNTVWSSVFSDCYDKIVGGRKGFRPPTATELASLVDPNAAEAPYLPPGHPFENVETIPPYSYYWTASTHNANSGIAWIVDFSTGDFLGGGKEGSIFSVWCVRGGPGNDPTPIFGD